MNAVRPLLLPPLLWLTPLIVYVAFAVPLLDVPLRWDEVEWPPQAQAILRRGIPEILPSESRYVFHQSAFSSRYGADYGLWHPPAYLYALAIPVALLGDRAAAVRSLGLLTGILTLLTVFAAAHRLARNRSVSETRSMLIGSLAAFLTAINPFWVHGSLSVDIDNTVLTLLTLVLLLVFCKPLDRSHSYPVSCVVILTLMLWTKPPGFVLVASGLFASLFLARRWRAAGKLGLALMLSGGIFVVTWFLYAITTDIPWNFPLVFTYGGKATAVGSRSIFESANALRFTGAWMGLPFDVLAVAACGLVLFGSKREVGAESLGERAFVFAALVIGGFYSAFWTFLGKYTVVLVPVLAVPIAIGVVRVLCTPQVVLSFGARRWLVPLVMSTMAIAVFAFQWFVVGDMITAPERRHVSGRTFALVLQDPRPLRYLAALVPIVLLVAGARLLAGMTWIRALFVGCLIAIVPANLVQGLKLMGHRDTSIIAPRSESGFLATASWLNAHSAPSDTIMTQKDLAYYLESGRVIPVDNERIFPAGDLQVAIREKRVEYIAADSQLLGELGLRSELQRYSLAEQIGSYQIYRRNLR